MQVYNDPRMFNLAAVTANLRALFPTEQIINVTPKQPTNADGDRHRLLRSKTRKMP